jgi:hypothetical protein
MRTFTALGIIRYDDKLGRCGRLLGLITFTDGKSLKVWDADLHQQCKTLAQFPVNEVRYQFRHSEKWGDALSMIGSTKADHELYDDARAEDEQRGHVKANSYIGQRIAKKTVSVNPETPVASVDITQAKTLPPDQVGDDHESLMRREG